MHTCQSLLIYCTCSLGATQQVMCIIASLLCHACLLLTLQGRMCLLLGPPGSGKSSLLKILAGKVRDSKLVQVSCACIPVLTCALIVWSESFACVIAVWLTWTHSHKSVQRLHHCVFSCMARSCAIAVAMLCNVHVSMPLGNWQSDMDLWPKQAHVLMPSKVFLLHSMTLLSLRVKLKSDLHSQDWLAC